MTDEQLIKFKELSMQDGRLNLSWFADYVAKAERESFYGQDKPASCLNGCPIGQVCDYCQIAKPMREMIASAIAREREECAKVADSWNRNVVWEGKTVAMNIAKEIRARGEKQ